MRTTTAARDQVTPALQKAQDTLTDTVLPAVVGALAVAKEKSADFLDSDAATEAKRRSLAVVKAARGDVVVAKSGRRWGFGIGMLALGVGIGAGIAYAVRALGQSAATYTPSGTDGGLTTTGTTDGVATAGTPDAEIDLTAGRPR